VPTYGYECTRCNEQFEVFQRITDAPLTTHEGCGGELRKLLYPVGILFKGPGFHVNDYGKTGRNGSGSKPAESPSLEKAGDTKPDAAKPETKPEGASESPAVAASAPAAKT